MSETWTEWGVRRTWGAVGTIAEFGRDRRTAEKCARDWPGVLVHRVVTASDWIDAADPTPDPARAVCRDETTTTAEEATNG